jgi:hypothetical protein
MGSGTVKIVVEYEEGEEEKYAAFSAGAITSGILTLDLPDPMGEKYLGTLDATDNVTVTPQGVKAVWARSIELYDGEDQYAGSLYFDRGTGNEATYSGDAIVYQYVTQPVRVSGTYKYEGSFETEPPEITYTYSRTYTYDITAKRGWNAYWSRYSGTSETISVTYKSDLRGFPSSAKWVFEPFDK